MTSDSTATYERTIELTPDGGATRFRRVLPHAVADSQEHDATRGLAPEVAS
jgi:hypothetical protein